MCLSTVYALGTQTPLCKNIAAARRGEDGAWRFVDIMGVTTVVRGDIERVDLMDNVIYIRARVEEEQAT